MHIVRRPAAWLAVAGLVAALHVAPASAEPRPPVEPAGIATLFKFTACAISVFAAVTPQALAGAFVTCARALYDEIQKNT